ncbi:MAG TPA: DUF4129 domain-containing protein [Puia sp.]|nr:DUF4129 domain-containing protein [Puia sp.]
MVSCFKGIAQDRPALPDSIAIADTALLNGNGSQPDPESSQTIIDTTSSETITADTSEKEDSLYLRTVPPSLVDSLKHASEFEYANDPAYWREEPKEPPSNYNWLEVLLNWLSKPIVRQFFLILVILVLAFAIYKIIIENKLYLFYSPSKRTANIDGSNEESEFTSADLDRKIAESLAANDYRSAFRFMYLKLLRTASEKGLIHLQVGDTNSDYLTQLKDHPISAHFRFLTNAYEYVWYGDFSLKPEQFQSLKSRFDTIYHNLNN